MVPKIDSGDLVTIEPIVVEPNVGDIVLAKVNGRQYLHLVSAVRGSQYQISNNHGFVNGWTKRANIFGIVTRVE